MCNNVECGMWNYLSNCDVRQGVQRWVQNPDKDAATPANKVHVNISFCKSPSDLWRVIMDCFTVNWHKKQDFKGFLQMFSK